MKAGRDLKGRSSFRTWILEVQTRFRRLRLMAGILILLLSLRALTLAGQGDGPCRKGDDYRAARELDCFGESLLDRVNTAQRILALSKIPPQDQVLREALVAASKIGSCINDFRLFPKEKQARADFRCLQRRLLDFYLEASRPETASALGFQDLLSRASLRIHTCMIDEDLTPAECLALIESGLEDYRVVFRQARGQPASLVSVGQASVSEKQGSGRTGPQAADLWKLVDLSLEASRRFPRLLGKTFGATLGPVLCDAYQMFPGQRSRISRLYNLLIRFDFGNLGSSVQLLGFLDRLADFFRPEPELATFFRLEPRDWSPSSPPCSSKEWILVFPRFSVRPGFRLPPLSRLRSQLEGLENLLLRTARLAGSRNHLWKPFQRYGTLLFEMAESLRPASLRSPRMWQTRQLLMARARNVFLLLGVDEDRHPLDPSSLRESIRRQINVYGNELLEELQFDLLIDFAEAYLKAGGELLGSSHKEELHRLLAIAYSVSGDQAQALKNLQKSRLEPARLRQILLRYQTLGIGVSPPG